MLVVCIAPAVPTQHLLTPGGTLLPAVPTRWELPSPPPSALRVRFNWLHPVVVQILYNRGLVEPDEVAEFFGQFVPDDDPFAMRGIPEAVEYLRRAIRQRTPIAVYGDFDADGVTATVLMVQTLRAFGADVMPYIPHRVDEGYGLNNEALAWLHRQGIQLVLTVDCGIRAVEEVQFARSLGLEIIVSDHHSLGPTLPPAHAVINPRHPQSSYPFKHFAGVGVAYKLAQALLREEEREPCARQPVVLGEERLLDLVALGTVADIMPLRGENRRLVQKGLEQLNRGVRPGVRALARKAHVELGQIDATAIGFRLAPRLNAAGRLDTAAIAYDLLMAPDDATAEPIAADLDRWNKERQRLTEEAYRWAILELGQDPPDHALFVGREDLNPGIVGLVASRLKDTYYRPALVVELGDVEVRGSARSIPEFHITRALDRCADLLVRYGGHAAAAGFTVRRELLPQLRRRLNAIAAEQLDPEDRAHKLAIDAVVCLRDLDWALLGKLRELEPTGSENPPALLAVPDLLVRSYRKVGSNGDHLKLKLTDGYLTFDAIAFGRGDLADAMPMRVDVACRLDENQYQGRRSLQLVIEDIKPAGRGIPSTYRF
ncbi:MAG: single-stranded-DNA-specific exonuclease RecJ [Caldilineae bacterium]|nr:MAG: single-stranded-DNA-specific exonuclease RecJ [Caldilineae bacterium]